MLLILVACIADESTRVGRPALGEPAAEVLLLWTERQVVHADAPVQEVSAVVPPRYSYCFQLTPSCIY